MCCGKRTRIVGSSWTRYAARRETHQRTWRKSRRTKQILRRRIWRTRACRRLLGHGKRRALDKAIRAIMIVIVLWYERATPFSYYVAFKKKLWLSDSFDDPPEDSCERLVNYSCSWRQYAINICECKIGVFSILHVIELAAATASSSFLPGQPAWECWCHMPFWWSKLGVSQIWLRLVTGTFR